MCHKKTRKNNLALESQIIKSIISVAGKKKLSLHEPSFIGNEYKYIKECIDTTYVSSIGPYVDKFEQEIIRYTGAKYAVALVNGTSALHLALKVLGVTCNDEVIIPAINFVASANAVTYCNALPHFVESDFENLSMCPHFLRKYLKEIAIVKNKCCFNKRTGNIIRAMIPMHTFGHPANMEELLLVAKEFNIKLIEDAAESLGSFYKGVHTGTLGDIGIFSFNGNKTITTGGGGVIVTNNSSLAKKVKNLSTTAKQRHPWKFIHNEIGYNYRMPNINAAIGCAQIEKLELFIQKKRKLYNLYSDSFSNVDGVTLLKEPNGCKSNYWLQTLRLDKKYIKKYDLIIENINKQKIQVRPVWKLISSLKMYKNSPRSSLKVAKFLEKSLINIPSSAFLVK